MPLTRARAEQLDAALSRDVPADLPADLALDLALVARLQSAGQACAPAPTDDFRTALRTRLLAVAAVQGIGETATAPSRSPARGAVSWRQRAGAVAAGVTASLVAVTGVAAAASASLPGDPFYGLKRTTEGVQLSLADGAAEEGERHLQFAETRLHELHQMALGRDLSGPPELGDDDADRVVGLLDDMDVETRSATRLLTEAFRDSRDAAPVERLAEFAERQHDGLSAVLPELPGVSRTRAGESLALVATVQTAAADLLMLRDCTAACDPSAAAPGLPGPAAPGGAGTAADEPCSCPTPAPSPVTAPVPTAPEPSEEPRPATSSPAPSSPSPAPSSPSPAPSPSPTSSPEPLPVPVPPLPTPTLPPLPGLSPDQPVQVPPLSGSGVLTGLAVPLSGGSLLALRRSRRR